MMLRCNDEQFQYDTFSWMKLPLVLLVLFIHNFGGEQYQMTFQWSNSYNIIRVSISHVFAHIAVPCFFIISGYLFFRNLKEWDHSIWKNKIKRRIYTLFLPYIIWIVIYIVFEMILGVRRDGITFIESYIRENNGWHMLWDCNVWNNGRLNIIGQVVPSTGPILIPLWYLRDLMVVTIITPILFCILKYFRFFGLLLLGLPYVLNLNLGVPGFTTTAIFFFSFGAFFSIAGKNLITLFRKYEIIVLILYVPLLILEIIHDGHNTYIGNIIYPWYVLVGSIFFFNLSSRIVGLELANWVSKYSGSVFFIFCSHMFILNYIRRALLIVSSPIVTYFVCPILTMIVCIGICQILNKYLPLFSKLLTGKR